MAPSAHKDHICLRHLEGICRNGRNTIRLGYPAREGPAGKLRRRIAGNRYSRTDIVSHRVGQAAHILRPFALYTVSDGRVCGVENLNHILALHHGIGESRLRNTIAVARRPIFVKRNLRSRYLCSNLHRLQVFSLQQCSAIVHVGAVFIVLYGHHFRRNWGSGKLKHQLVNAAAVTAACRAVIVLSLAGVLRKNVNHIAVAGLRIGVNLGNLRADIVDLSYGIPAVGYLQQIVQFCIFCTIARIIFSIVNALCLGNRHTRKRASRAVPAIESQILLIILSG